MKHLYLYILLTFVFISCGNKETTQKEPETSGKDSVNIVYAIRQQSRLYTSQYDIHKIVTRDDVKKVEGSLFGRKFSHVLSWGDRKIAIPMDVTLQAYIDFSLFCESNVSSDGKKIHILLPDPRVVVTSSKIDNAGIKQQVGTFRSDFSDSEMTDFTQQGVASVIASVPQLGIIENARENAASILVPLLVSCGYAEENILITFRKDFSTGDVPSLYDSEGSVVKF